MYNDDRRDYSHVNQRPVIELVAKVSFRLRKGYTEKSVSYHAIYRGEWVSISDEEYKKPYDYKLAKKYFELGENVEYNYRAY